MKKIISLLLLILNSYVYSQTKLDTLVYKKINELRTQSGLTTLSLEQNCNSAAKNHTRYILEINKTKWPNSHCGHNQEVLKRPIDRYMFYSKETPLRLGEVVLTITRNFSEISEDSMFTALSSQIVELWKSSKGHHAILVGDFTYIGVSTKFFTKKNGFNNSTNYRIVSTAVLMKKN